MNMRFLKLINSLSAGAGRTFGLVLFACLMVAPGHAVAVDTLVKTNVFIWLSSMPSWMPSVLLITTLMGFSWLGFVLIRRWLSATGRARRNNRIGYFAVLVAALVGILLAPTATETWQNYLAECINYLPPSAAGNTSSSTVALSWSASTAANVGGYKVYYGTSSGVYSASVDAGNNTGYQVSGLQQGIPYYFAVKAYDLTKTVEGSPSTEITATATSPTVNFTASQTSGNAPIIVNFTPTVNATITGWKWNFGDGTTNSGNTSTVPNAIKQYESPGTYSVSLTVTGSGWSITQTYANLIAAIPPPPTAVNFTASPTNGNAPLVAYFTPTLTGGTITNWQWSFGDGNTVAGTGSVVPPVTWSYANAGSYNVSLTVTGPGGSITQTNPNFITVSTSSLGSGTGSGTGTGSSATQSGLVAAYGFDEYRVGSSVLDSSGLGNLGSSLNTVQVTGGKFGKAMQFNGTNAWVTVNNSKSLALGTGMTLEAWVYPVAAMSGMETVVMKEQPATATSTGTATYLLAANNSANQPMSAVWNGNEATLNGNTQIPPNQWTHLATTYDGQYQNMYINGVLVETLPQNGAITTSTGVLRIGGNSIWGGYFNGYIDEVRIYNMALSNTQIISDSKTPITVSNPPEFVVGDPSVESTMQSYPQGVPLAFNITPQQSKTVTNIQVYLDASSTATGLIAGIYTIDANGNPAVQWTSGPLTSVTPGVWNSIPVAKLSLNAGQSYWIAILGSGGTVNLRTQPTTGSGLMAVSASSNLTNVPNTWNAGSISTIGSVSVYGAGY